MKRSAQRSRRRNWIYALIGIVSLGSLIWFSRDGPKHPSYTGVIERRDYEFIVLLPEGPSIGERIDRFQHRFARPGQTKLVERFMSPSPPSDFQAALEEFGYKFPPGTEARAVNSTVPVFFIQHYPDVLDTLELEFELEQR